MFNRCVPGSAPGGDGGGFGCHRAAAAPAAPWGYERSAGRPRGAAVPPPPPPRSASRSRTAASCWGSTRVAASRASTGSAPGQVRAVPGTPDPPLPAPQGPPTTLWDPHPPVPSAVPAEGAARLACRRCREGCASCRDDAPCEVQEDRALRAAVLCCQACCMLAVFLCMLLAYHCRRSKARAARGPHDPTASVHPPPHHHPGGTFPLHAPSAADVPLSLQRIRASGVVLLETILFGSLLLYFPVSARPKPPLLSESPTPPCTKPRRARAAPCCRGAELWGFAVG